MFEKHLEADEFSEFIDTIIDSFSVPCDNYKITSEDTSVYESVLDILM